MVELMIVIGILGLLFVTMQNFNASASINQQKVIRLSTLISDMLSTARHNTTIGKTASGEAVKERHVTLTGWENSITLEEISATGRLIGSSKQNILLDGDKAYKIDSILVSSGTLNPDYSGSILTNPISVSGATIKFTGDLSGKIEVPSSSPISSGAIQSYVIVVDYKWFKRYIAGDTIVGNVTVRENNPH